MTVPVIMDTIAGAVLLGFALAGGRRGLLRSVAGLAIVLVSLVGAGILAAQLTPAAAARLQPYIEKRVEVRVDRALAGESPPEASVQMPEAEEGDSLLERAETRRLLGLLGLDDDPARSITDSVQEKVRDTGVDLLTAAVESIAESVLHTLLFLLCFAGLLLGLRLLLRALDLVAKLPGLHLLNQLGGGAIGALEGALCLFLAVWALRRLGVSFETDLVDKTYILQFFTANSPLSVLSFLKA